jgi:outer membrane protein OmpA-like peptidoglycan-associated protein
MFSLFRKLTTGLLILGVSFMSASDIAAQGFEKLTQLIDSARVMGAATFAPSTMQRAEEEYSKAQSAVESGKKQSDIDDAVAKATEFAENAIKASEVAKLSLNEYLEPREKALEAKAVSLVPELYFKAEEIFVNAAGRVESGDVKNGLKEAAKSVPFYQVAELEAIRKSILGAADATILKAREDGADKYAPSTLDKAVTARSKANDLLNKDHNNRNEAISEASRSEYEARHASNIALSVRSLNRNEQAWEKLMMVYEIQMNRVGEVIGAEHLPFDNGPLAAADSLIKYIQTTQKQNEYMTQKFTEIIAKTGETVEPGSPMALADKASEKVGNLSVQNQMVSTELESKQAKLTNLEETNKTITAELSEHQKREEKLQKAKTLLKPSEGQVVVNASNDIVLRLNGLSFDVGKAHIKESHIPLLEKLRQIVAMFPSAKIVVEGHTDASGNATTNMLLSEKRAFAIMQYLRQTLTLPSEKIKSMGYGSDKPIASNESPDGRAQNRRIDVVIMP